MGEQMGEQILETLRNYWDQFVELFLSWSQSPACYTQLGVVFGATLLAFLVSPIVKSRFREPKEGGRYFVLRSFLYDLRFLTLPLLCFLFAATGVLLLDNFYGVSWLVRILEGLCLIWLIFVAARRYIRDSFMIFLIKWVLIPLATLKVFGWFDDLMILLDSFSLQLGDINISAQHVGRGIVVGAVLFWLGRHSNTAGKQAIRKRENLDVGTRELLAKLFEIILYIVLFMVLLQVVGINLTTLTVLGGAVGVGIGFGLQQIAANFISGMIILFDRSIKVGDHIELEGEIFGVLQEIKLRYAVIETYEGKEVLIPNETFITNIFTNWSGTDDKQRYSFTFSVAYSTDLHHLFDVVRDVVGSHPQVISGDDAPVEERPDAEIDEFADSGVSVLVEFWMHGVDDGRNRVDADLKLMIWDAMKEHGFKMPFPQREVRILGDERVEK